MGGADPDLSSRDGKTCYFPVTRVTRLNLKPSVASRERLATPPAHATNWFYPLVHSVGSWSLGRRGNELRASKQLPVSHQMNKIRISTQTGNEEVLKINRNLGPSVTHHAPLCLTASFQPHQDIFIKMLYFLSKRPYLYVYLIILFPMNLTIIPPKLPGQSDHFLSEF